MTPYRATATPFVPNLVFLDLFWVQVLSWMQVLSLDASLTFRMQVLSLDANLIFRMQVLSLDASLTFRMQVLFLDAGSLADSDLHTYS